MRLYDPTKYKVGPLTFSQNGPRNRFDHHRTSPIGQSAWDDPERSVYYCALTLSCCIVEVFGNYKLVDKPQMNIAMPTVTRPLRLLDLCGAGAMRAGSISALCGTADRSLSQNWSRYFYEEAVYGNCDGLCYHSAHNNEKAFALYERAANGLSCAASQVLALTEPGLRPELLRIILDNNMLLLI